MEEKVRIKRPKNKSKSKPTKTKNIKRVKNETFESFESTKDNESSREESSHSIREESIVETAIVEKEKPKGKIWSAKNKRDLEAAFRAFNPCNEKDWELVRDALPVEWPVEELKIQTKKMKLQFAATKKPATPKTALIDKLRTLVPDGKLPGKGTYKREALKEELMQHLYVRRNEKENEHALGQSLDDSDDMVRLLFTTLKSFQFSLFARP
jgi:hypothetical protein